MPEPNRIARLSLRLAGWEFEGGVPSIPKYVALAVPHTSNWDGVLLVSLLQSIGLKMEWMIKDSWVKGPQAGLMRRLGAVGINRSRASNVVEQMVELFRQRDELVVGIPPEGTRSRAEHWKSGFYHIARQANVPVVPGYLDYGRRRAGLGEPIPLTGEVRADMDRIRAFYEKMKPAPHSPSDFGPIRLREEG